MLVNESAWDNKKPVARIEQRVVGWIDALRDDNLERVKGIEPSYEAWEAAVLPLNYTRSGPDSSVWRRAAGAVYSTRVCDCSRRYCGRYQNEPIALPVLPLPFQPPKGW